MTGNGPSIRDRYERLRQYLGIDLLQLDESFMRLPPTIQDAGELAAEADAKENAAKHALDVVRAEAAERLRVIPISGKEPSQARIDSMLPLEDDVQEAWRALNAARYESQICGSLFKVLGDQSRLLQKAADMIVTGYITPSSAHENRRAEIHRARLKDGEKGKTIERPS